MRRLGSYGSRSISSVGFRLAYLEKPIYEQLSQLCRETSKFLGGLLRSLRPRASVA